MAQRTARSTGRRHPHSSPRSVRGDLSTESARRPSHQHLLKRKHEPTSDSGKTSTCLGKTRSYQKNGTIIYKVESFQVSTFLNISHSLTNFSKYKQISDLKKHLLPFDQIFYICTVENFISFPHVIGTRESSPFDTETKYHHILKHEPPIRRGKPYPRTE